MGGLHHDQTVVMEATRNFEAATEAYHRELDGLHHRIGNAAWKFFRYGYSETGLHDGRLMDFQIIDNSAGRRVRSRQFTSAVFEFYNYTEQFIHRFELRNVTVCRVNIALAVDPLEGNLGDLYTYELVKEDADRLTLGFVFANGSEIETTFRRLLYKRTRVR